MRGTRSLTELGCEGIHQFVDTYLDGEFGEVEVKEFELHVGRCEPCRELVRKQSEWKQAIKGSAPREELPAGFEDRLRMKLREQRAERSWARWAVRVLPLAAAAGFMMTWGISRLHLAPVAADVVAKHKRNLPIEVAGEREAVKNWYVDKVDFPVRPPVFRPTPRVKNAALKGGRLAELRDQQAAYLVYDVDGSKVSVFIFDAAQMPMSAPKQMRVRDREVYLGEARGSNVALYQDRGVGYAIIGDLAEERLIDLVSASLEE